MSEIGSQETVKRMFGSISTRRGGLVSESTRRTYLFYISRFCEFCDKTPDELIRDRMGDWKSDDIFTRRRHEEMLTRFAQHLREKGYTSNTVATAVGAVRCLYRTNYLPITEVNVPSGRPVRKYKVPTKYELVQAIEAVKVPWHGAFMTLTKDCGISLQDMLALRLGNGSPTYGTIGQQLREGRVPMHLHIVREKTQYRYDTFLGEDSFEALNEIDLGESRLFPYSDSAIQMAMNGIGKELGWKSFTPYSLRKWFRTQLTLDDLNEALIEYMMGHALGRVKAAYLIPPPQKLMRIYEGHYDALKL